MVGAASSIEPGSSVAVDRRADQQLQQVDVLRDGGALPREVGLGRGENLLGLAQVGARRDAAFEPGAGQARRFSRRSPRSAAAISSRLESAA